MSWGQSELDLVGSATELDLATRRPDQSLSRYTTMWVVRVGDDLFVRSAYGPDSAWYRRATRHLRGRIRAGGEELDALFVHLAPDDPAHATIDQAFHAKYDRYGPRIVGTVVGGQAANVTLRLDPAPQRA